MLSNCTQGQLMQNELEPFENYVWRWVMFLPDMLSGWMLCSVLHFKGEIQHPGELHLSTGRDLFYHQFVSFV